MRYSLTASALAAAVIACGTTVSPRGKPLGFYLDSLSAALPAWQLPDSTAPDSLRRFLSGDPDNDGRRDLALLLARGDSGILLFLRGAAGGEFLSPEVLGKAPDMGSDILVWNGGALLLGPWASDNSFDWKWDSASGKMKYDDTRPAEE